MNQTLLAGPRKVPRDSIEHMTAILIAQLSKAVKIPEMSLMIEFSILRTKDNKGINKIAKNQSSALFRTKGMRETTTEMISLYKTSDTTNKKDKSSVEKTFQKNEVHQMRGSSENHRSKNLHAKNNEVSKEIEALMSKNTPHL